MLVFKTLETEQECDIKIRRNPFKYLSLRFLLKVNTHHKPAPSTTSFVP